jgi:hypothetical protein
MFFNPFGNDPFAAFARQPQQPMAQANPQPTQYHNTPPASSRQISSLPLVTITVDDLQEQSNKECLICLEEQRLGGRACKLPCGHIYHKECITEWLSKHANCPFCRYELETNDEAYETLRKKNNENRKLRFRRDELDHKSISQLRELCQTLHVGIHGCVDKHDIVDRLIASGRIIVVENVPAIEISTSAFEVMSVRELQHLLLSFGLPAQGLLEKSELRATLLNSGRVVIVNDSSSSSSSSTAAAAVPASAQEIPVAIEDMSVSQLINYCRDQSLDISKCINRDDLIDCIHFAKGSSPSATSVNATATIWESKSIKDLKNLAYANGIDISDCLEKQDIINRLRSSNRRILVNS